MIQKCQLYVIQILKIKNAPLEQEIVATKLHRWVVNAIKHGLCGIRARIDAA